MTVVRKVDFNALPQAARERLVECFRSEGSPRPHVAQIHSWAPIVALCITMALVGTGILLEARQVGFGERSQGPSAIVGHGVGASLLFTALLILVRAVVLRKKLPFAPGRYVLPMDYIVATDRELTVISMTSLAEVRCIHQSYEGLYINSRLVFTFYDNVSESLLVRGRERAEQAAARITQSVAQIREMLAPPGAQASEELDPLFEVRRNGTWNRAAPNVPTGAGPWAGFLPQVLNWKFIVPLALSSIGFLGFPLWAARNEASDEVMFVQAKRSNTVIAYETYLQNGKKHESEVRSTLLPKAALEEAKRAGTLAALREFLRAYPGSAVEAEAQQEIARYFENIRQGFRAQAATTDARLGPFMDKLVDYLEKKNDPRVDVRFHGPSPASFGVLDALVNTKSSGKAVPMASYIKEQDLMAYESAIVKHLGKGLGTIVPKDVLQLSLGSRTTEKGDEPPFLLTSAEAASKATTEKFDPTRIDVPVLDIRYRLGWSGKFYDEPNGNRKFAALVIRFHGTMAIPNEKEYFDFDVDVLPPESYAPEYTSIYRGISSRLESNERSTLGRAYEAMVGRGFDELMTNLRRLFFKPDTKAFNGVF